MASAPTIKEIIDGFKKMGIEAVEAGTGIRDIKIISINYELFLSYLISAISGYQSRGYKTDIKLEHINSLTKSELSILANNYENSWNGKSSDLPEPNLLAIEYIETKFNLKNYYANETTEENTRTVERKEENKGDTENTGVVEEKEEDKKEENIITATSKKRNFFIKKIRK